MKFPIFVKVCEICHIFALKLIAQNFRTDKKVIGRFSDLSILCNATAGNDAVYVHMVFQLLIPCMKYLDDPRSCSQPFFIGSQLQKGFGTASV